MISKLAITFSPTPSAPACAAARISGFAMALLLASLALPAVAQQPRSLNDCQNITDRAARFECYDKVESVPRSAPTGATLSTIPATRAAPAAAPAAPAAAASSSTAVVRETEEREPLLKRILPFGLGDDDEETESSNTTAETATPAAPVSEVDSFGREESERQKQATENRELIDTIASLEETEPNTWRVTLSNGQIWQQVTGKRYLMKAGDQVRIRQSGWGSSYRLYVDRIGSYIQVDRVD